MTRESWEESVSAQQSKIQGDAIVMAANQQVKDINGRNTIAALHTTHGKYAKAKRQEAQKSPEVGRKVRAEIKLIETCLIEQGVPIGIGARLVVSKPRLGFQPRSGVALGKSW